MYNAVCAYGEPYSISGLGIFGTNSIIVSGYPLRIRKDLADSHEQEDEDDNN